MAVLIAALGCAALVVSQVVWPGLSWYHSGTYAGLLFGGIAYMLLALRRFWRTKDRQANALSMVCFGASIIALCGLATALLAPDTQTIPRGPGERVPLSEPRGILVFPMAQSTSGTIDSEPSLRRGNSEVSIPSSGRRYLAAYILWTQPRATAYVQAFDLQNRHLTLTQPQSTSFLSPVLLFPRISAIGGHDLPVDSFAVPAAHRSVKAFLFRGGILFAVEDERGQLLPGAIKLAQSGERIQAGGVRLQGALATFPAVIIASAPYLPLVALGIVIMLTGVVVLLRLPKRQSAP